MLGRESIRQTNAARGWRRDFRWFWLSSGATFTAEQVREFAIPLIAISALQASAVDLGVLGALQWLPFLVLALPLGVVIDRHRRRGILLVSEASRALIAIALTLLVAAGALSLPLLFVAVVALGVFATVFEVGYQSVIPSLVPRDRLAAANARVQATAAAAEIGGPGLAGAMLQVLSAGAALAATAGAYLVSAGALAAMRGAESTPPRVRRRFLVELREGARHVIADPYLRANVGFSALYNPFAQWVTLLLTLYAVTDLGMSSAQVGVIFSLGAAGAVVGAATASRVAARTTIGRIMVACASVECVALLCTAAVPPDIGAGLAVAMLGILLALNGAGTAMSSVLLITIRQMRTPDALLGRVNATMRTVSYGTIPIGALAGGLVGEWLGTRAGILVGAVLCLGTVAWVMGSPLRRIRRLEDVRPVSVAPPAA
jgi:MFS family permease